jgi:two-component system, LytTR family, response regulator
MNNYTCVIIDDEKDAIESLKIVLENTQLLRVIGIFSNPQTAIKSVVDLKPDFIFLDIQMPKMTGIEVAEILQNQIKCHFIFTTGHMEYALQSYSFDTIDYLLKPITLPRLMKSIYKALRITGIEAKNAEVLHSDTQKGSIMVETLEKGKKINVNIDNIEYVESDKNCIMITLKKGEILKVKMTLKNIIDLLPQNSFKRVHRRFIIQMNCIKSFTAEHIILYSAKRNIPIGRTYKVQLRNAFVQQ